MGLTPGLVGVYQANFTLPVSAPSGDLPIQLQLHYCEDACIFWRPGVGVFAVRPSASPLIGACPSARRRCRVFILSVSKGIPFGTKFKLPISPLNSRVFAREHRTAQLLRDARTSILIEPLPTQRPPKRSPYG